MSTNTEFYKNQQQHWWKREEVTESDSKIGHSESSQCLLGKWKLKQNLWMWMVVSGKTWAQMEHCAQSESNWTVG